MVENLTFITGNTAKAEHLGRHLDFPVSHIKLDPQESRFVLQSLRNVRDFPIAREIEANATRMLNDYAETYMEMNGGKGPVLPEVNEIIRPY